VAIAPGALPQAAVVSITPVDPSALVMPAPTADLPFGAAFRLDFGGQDLSVPVQLAIRVDPSVPAGTEVYFFHADSLPDTTGAMRPVWLLQDSGVVGVDGFARTASPPYSGISSAGDYYMMLLTHKLALLSYSPPAVPNLAATAILF